MIAVYSYKSAEKLEATQWTTAFGFCLSTSLKLSVDWTVNFLWKVTINTHKFSSSLLIEASLLGYSALWEGNSNNNNLFYQESNTFGTVILKYFTKRTQLPEND